MSLGTRRHSETPPTCNIRRMVPYRRSPSLPRPGANGNRGVFPRGVLLRGNLRALRFLLFQRLVRDRCGERRDVEPELSYAHRRLLLLVYPGLSNEVSARVRHRTRPRGPPPPPGLGRDARRPHCDPVFLPAEVQVPPLHRLAPLRRRVRSCGHLEPLEASPNRPDSKPEPRKAIRRDPVLVYHLLLPRIHDKRAHRHAAESGSPTPVFHPPRYPRDSCAPDPSADPSRSNLRGRPQVPGKTLRTSRGLPDLQ